MSEAALAPAPSLRARMLPVRRHRNRLNSLEALERGFALFRSTFVQEAWRYYAGSAPLVFCFIPMWVVNGQIRLSNGIVLLEAALLAACYLLRLCMVASYMQRVRERAFGTPSSEPAGTTARAAAVGRLLAWKITLSAGVLAALPTFAGASWFYSACQFASLEAREEGAERHSIARLLSNREPMVWRQRAPILDALSFLDRRVAEWPDPSDDSSAASALHFWAEHSPVYTNGNVRSDPKFRILAFVVRGRMVGP